MTSLRERLGRFGTDPYPGFIDPADAEKIQLRREHQKRLLKQHFIEWQPGELTRRNGHIVSPEGFLLDRHDAIVLESGAVVNNDPSGFVDTGSEFVFYATRGGAGPRTLDELEQRNRDREQSRADLEAERTARLRAEPRRPILLADLEDRENVTMPTVSEAARAVLRDGGELQVHDGRLVVLAPRETLRGLRRAVKVLAAAEDLVVAELNKESDVPIDVRLPDRAVTATGALAP